MKYRPLIIYLSILAIMSAAFIIAAKSLGRQGAYLLQGYMLTPAIAALITRLFFYGPGFRDANLRFGGVKDYFRFWLLSIGISAVSFAIFSATTFSYYAVIKDQLLANMGLATTMLMVALYLHYSGELKVFSEYFERADETSGREP